MSIADNPRSHAQVTPFYQVRTTHVPVYQAQGAVNRHRPRPSHAGLAYKPQIMTYTSFSGYVSNSYCKSI